MADGVFHQGPGPFNLAQNHPHPITSRHLQQRKNSPAPGPRSIYTNDNASPSRSPTRRPPSQPFLSMYGQSHQQTNVFMNGTHSSQRYNLQMNKVFQPNHQSQPQSHHRQQQDHNNGFLNHQHNTSGSNFTSGSSHLNHAQMRKGTPNQLHNGTGRPQTEEGQRQIALYEELREQSGTHPHARTNTHTGKAPTTTTDQVRKDADREEKHRAVRESDQDRNTWTELDLGGLGLPAISLDLFKYDFLKKLYLTKNHLTHVPAAIGKLRSLNYLDLSFNQILEIPPEVGMLINLKVLLLFENRIETLPFELGYLFQLEVLGMIGNPISERDMATIEERGTKALIAELQETAEPQPPVDRDWHEVDDPSTNPSGIEDTFKVMSYNSLCDRAATRAQYGYTPPQFLAWEHRKGLILNECRARNADILCLQEVAQEAYSEYFRPELAHDGYRGTYYSKGRARMMTEKEAKSVDGCATLWKNSKYVQLDRQTIDFSTIAINRPDFKAGSDVFNRVMPRDNIALCTFLEDRVSGARVLVVNAHLHWDQDQVDVKVVQAGILLQQVNKLTEDYAKWPPTPLSEKKLYRFAGNDSAGDGVDPPLPERQIEPGPSQSYPDAKSIPLIICIDANSTPDSGVYELLTTGSLARDHRDLGKYQYGKFTSEGMRHDLSLKSAYGIKDLKFTNYTAGFTGIIDYIFYSANAFQVTGLLGEVDPAYLQRVPGFPNVHFPSDHLSLETEFVVKQRKGERRP